MEMRTDDLMDIGCCVNMRRYESSLEMCVWKEVHELNMRGVGTSFVSNKYVKCKDCDGYRRDCSEYYREERK